MNNLIIRPAKDSDVETIAQFQIAMAHETESLGLDPTTVLRGVTAVLRDKNKGEYWVAEQDARCVACLLLIPEWSDWRAATVLWIHSVYVIPECRKHGVFRQMYAQVKQRVECDTGLAGLRLFVDRTNTSAQKTYEAVGMSAEHYALYEWLKEAH